MSQGEQPLAARLRPQTLEEFAGQAHLLGENKPLSRAIRSGRLHSMILWGPPGTGKTTLARLLSHYANARFLTISAVLAGVKEIRAAVEQAQLTRQQHQQSSILFVDEVHRFNKAQQDAFLPYVEDGVITFIGATTENPAFELNNALLSRARVYVLKALDEADIIGLLQRALDDPERGYGGAIQCAPELLQQLARHSQGDARHALNLLEIVLEVAQSEQQTQVSEELLASVLAGGSYRQFDKGGDIFYEQISALHKAVRGSSPDAALYWLCRMLDGGCDPHYIARRIVRMASEDIGNADPRALTLALNAWDTQTRLGSPEGELALAQAVTYLASAAKSNAVYTAYNAAMADVRATGNLPVPLHLRNAPRKLLKQQGYGRDYRYAHDEPNAYAAGEQYFPDELAERQYYQPVERGLEIKIKEKLAWLHSLDAAANADKD